MKNFLFLLLACFAACKPSSSTIESSAEFVNSEGTIKVFVCSRGCYQYLLETDGKLYFPDQLPEDLKTDGQLVIFDGKTSPEKTMVKKPGANDVPIPAFEAQNLHIVKMLKK